MPWLTYKRGLINTLAHDERLKAVVMRWQLGLCLCTVLYSRPTVPGTYTICVNYGRILGIEQCFIRRCACMNVLFYKFAPPPVTCSGDSDVCILFSAHVDQF